MDRRTAVRTTSAEAEDSIISRLNKDKVPSGVAFSSVEQNKLPLGAFFSRRMKK